MGLNLDFGEPRKHVRGKTESNEFLNARLNLKFAPKSTVISFQEPVYSTKATVKHLETGLVRHYEIRRHSKTLTLSSHIVFTVQMTCLKRLATFCSSFMAEQQD